MGWRSARPALASSNPQAAQPNRSAPSTLAKIAVTFHGMGIRQDWRTDRARILWFLAHGAALAILMAVTDFGHGRAFLIGGALITASYGIGYVVLSIRAVRRASSSSSKRQQ